MTRYYAGPPEWRTQGLITGYAAPAGVFSWIDLRNMGTQSAANHSSGVGNGFFCTPDDVSLPSEYTLIGTGDLRETNISGQAKSAWASLYGVSLNGGVNTILDALSYTLGDGSDPDGDTAPKPLMPGVLPQNEALIELAGHSVVYRRKLNLISGTSDHAKKCRDRMQKDLAEIAETDDALFRKCLGRMKEKCGLRWDSPNEGWLLHAKVKDKGKGSNGKTIAERPASVFMESFPSNSAITTGQDLGWSMFMGSLITAASGTISCAADSTHHKGRMTSATSSSDTYSQILITDAKTAACNGAISTQTRKDSSGTQTCYDAQVFRSASDLWYLGKYIAGVYTALHTSTATPAGILKQTSSGSGISATMNGGSSLGATDTAISSGTYGGVGLYSAGTSLVGGSYEFGDLVSAVSDFVRRHGLSIPMALMCQ